MDVLDSVYKIGDFVEDKRRQCQFGVGVIVSAFRLHSDIDQTRYVVETKKGLKIRRPIHIRQFITYLTATQHGQYPCQFSLPTKK